VKDKAKITEVHKSVREGIEYLCDQGVLEFAMISVDMEITVVVKGEEALRSVGLLEKLKLEILGEVDQLSPNTTPIMSSKAKQGEMAGRISELVEEHLQSERRGVGKKEKSPKKGKPSGFNFDEWKKEQGLND
jgi:hypothetical protein